MPELAASKTRAPSGGGQKVVKGTSITAAAGLILLQLWPHMDAAAVVLFAGALAAFISAVGSQVRNYLHTFEPGGSRAGSGTRPGKDLGAFGEIVLGLVGKLI